MKILILGGGFCGTLTAKLLERSLPRAEIILIDKKSYFEFSPSIHKVVFDKDYFKKIIINYEKIFKRVKFIKDEVLEVTPKLVKTKNNVFSFDFLVISLGITYPINLKNKVNVFSLKHVSDIMNASVLSSKKILVIGGGLIGTEIAGELATKTDKEIILVHSKNRLLERNPEKASNYAFDFLKNRNVRILLNEKVIDHKNNVFITSKGTKISANLALWCAGIKPDASFMNGFNKITDKNGFVKVNSFLQLNNNVFVGGDLNNVDEEKTAQNAERHAHCIANNIESLINKKSLTVHKPRSGPLVISLGDWHGILTFKPDEFLQENSWVIKNCKFLTNFTIKGILPGILKHLIEWWILRIKY